MFVSKIAPERRTWGLPVQPTCRAEHARMLAIAAARRLRAVERAGLHRDEDAGYWKAVAPTAVRKAAGLRAEASFAPLPG